MSGIGHIQAGSHPPGGFDALSDFDESKVQGQAQAALSPLAQALAERGPAGPIDATQRFDARMRAMHDEAARRAHMEQGFLGSFSNAGGQQLSDLNAHAGQTIAQGAAWNVEGAGGVTPPELNQGLWGNLDEWLEEHKHLDPKTIEKIWAVEDEIRQLMLDNQKKHTAPIQF